MVYIMINRILINKNVIFKYIRKVTSFFTIPFQTIKILRNIFQLSILHIILKNIFLTFDILS